MSNSADIQNGPPKGSRSYDTWLQQIVEVKELITVPGTETEKVNNLLAKGWKIFQGFPVGGMRHDGTPYLIYCLYLNRAAKIRAGQTNNE